MCEAVRNESKGTTTGREQESQQEGRVCQEGAVLKRLRGSCSKGMRDVREGGKNKAAVAGFLGPSVWEAKINPGNYSTLRPVLETAEQHPIFT